MNKPKLLLIEDHEQTYRAMRSLLRHDWHVMHSATVHGGLILLECSPAVVILDLMLDDGDGLAVLRQIRQQGFRARVVVTTGIPDGPHMDALLALGPDAVLRKPYHPKELEAALAPDRSPRPIET